MDKSLTIDEAKKVFKSVDANGDGHIVFKEFMKLFT